MFTLVLCLGGGFFIALIAYALTGMGITVAVCLIKPFLPFHKPSAASPRDERALL